MAGCIGDENLQLGRQEQTGAAVDICWSNAVLSHSHHHHRFASSLFSCLRNFIMRSP